MKSLRGNVLVTQDQKILQYSHGDIGKISTWDGLTLVTTNLINTKTVFTQRDNKKLISNGGAAPASNTSNDSIWGASTLSIGNNNPRVEISTIAVFDSLSDAEMQEITQ